MSRPRTEHFSDDDLRMLAGIEDSDQRKSSRRRHQKDLRRDRKRNTVLHKAAQKALPYGSKRRNVVLGGGAAVLGSAAIYGGSKAIEGGAKQAAQVAYKAGKHIETGAPDVEAPYGEGVDVSVDDVQDAMADGVTSSVELNSPTPEDQTVVIADESSEAPTGGIAPEDTPDTGGIDATSSDAN